MHNTKRNQAGGGFLAIMILLMGAVALYVLTGPGPLGG